jgi:plasmid stabilization system protein ParE
MSRKLTILPAALGDLAYIADWYDQHTESLCDAFLKAVDGALNQLVQSPFQYQIVYRQFRRAPVKRFPYALYYLVSEDTIAVAACIHGRRNVPRILQRR